jgi:formylglycine-generating enzyme required for sulfatase activity
MGTIVHEWCLDWYRRDYYAVSPECDPRGPDEGERRASRGGSWRHRVRWSPPAARSSLPPAFRYADYGFRMLREES